MRNAPSCGEKEADAGLAYGVEWRTPGVFLTIYNSRAAADERKNKPNWAELQQVERLPDFSHFRVSSFSRIKQMHTHGVRWTILFIKSARGLDALRPPWRRIHPDRYAGGEFK